MRNVLSASIKGSRFHFIQIHSGIRTESSVAMIDVHNLIRGGIEAAEKVNVACWAFRHVIKSTFNWSSWLIGGLACDAELAEQIV